MNTFEKLGLKLPPAREKSEDYKLMKAIEAAIPGALVSCGMNSVVGHYVVNVSLRGYVLDEQINAARKTAIEISGLPAEYVSVEGGYDEEVA